MKRTMRFLGVLLVTLFLSSSFFMQKEVTAAPILCGIKSVEPSIGAHSLMGDVTIQCSGSQVWSFIRSTATFTNSTGKVNNYNNTGGYSRASEHFNKMPGKTTVKTNGTKIKTSSGKTVTLYKSTSTKQWSLSYPNGSMTDKIR
ncbi:hypothetical protein MUB24_17650 [Lederbergia sp. NSJ-179]|uniref:hypothetical protein n=1 Tax=Lederbergia sp. NSJ-179 TaxID=2931402 RepID=UPI001FD1D72F|nr:hypothetical protein [Lederbergia sp. NSJ-179]MCJ7842690.1 hypothetical protein [Lederbergia sp. NSJ-179]